MDKALKEMLEKLGIKYTQNAQGLLLYLVIEVKPQAKKSLISWKNQTIKISINAPAVEGKANYATQALLAKTFSVAKSFVELTGGEKSRRKTFLVLIPDARLDLLKTTLGKIYEN